ncbi:conjugal transfer protein TrbF [Caulobacter sp. 602-2]|uniref:Conjugal transfer protein TrbF n=1 Tax=Caulobacter sp. 602-2 TaxID=2710887 RepID=A0A6G4QVC9_9CAUL|nr:conjugal transfer protein TrbF [Caulobacter sp. 602-2]NGM49284.1 conjugal transfer protein TrbF [Caulobacter sp. 602-2]
MRFSRSPQRYGLTPAPETPYQRAGQLWDARMGSALAQAYSWRLAFFGCLAVLGGSVAGNVWQSMQSRVTPYVVEVDRLGEARSIGPAEQDWQPGDGVLAQTLERFIVDVRSLAADPVVVRDRWLDAYDMVTGQGRVFLDPYARTASAAATAGERTISVQPISTVRASEHSFRVDWEEQVFERGSLADTQRWTATLTLRRIKPKTKAELKRNPLGFYIDSIAWSEQVKARPPAQPVVVPQALPSLEPTSSQGAVQP